MAFWGGTHFCNVYLHGLDPEAKALSPNDSNYRSSDIKIVMRLKAEYHSDIGGMHAQICHVLCDVLEKTSFRGATFPGCGCD